MHKHKAYESYLVGLARLGDHMAYEKLVHLISPRFFNHAYRLLQNREEARDSVQDAWLEITRGLAKLRDDRAFVPWGYQIVSRRCARQIAQNIKNREISTSVLSDDPPFEDGLSVHAAISRLPPAQAATIRLFYIEEMNVREVAFALDVPEGTVKSRLSAARNTLKTYLKGYENAKY